jgi:hypothetical protein
LLAGLRLLCDARPLVGIDCHPILANCAGWLAPDLLILVDFSEIAADVDTAPFMAGRPE